MDFLWILGRFLSVIVIFAAVFMGTMGVLLQHLKQHAPISWILPSLAFGIAVAAGGAAAYLGYRFLFKSPITN